MNLADLIVHVGNFFAPAVVVACLTALAGRWILPVDARWPVLWIRIGVGFLACSACLVAGLWWYGRDGRMSTYIAMGVVAACVQFVLMRGWRRG